MKTLTFNKTSWHYIIAAFGGFNEWKDQDLCTYTRRFMLGILKAALFGVLIAGAGFVLAHILLGIAFSIYYGTMLFSLVAEFAILVIYVLSLGLGGAICCLYVGTKIHDYANRDSNKEDNFIKHAYKGWKEKYCVRITIRD